MSLITICLTKRICFWIWSNYYNEIGEELDKHIPITFIVTGSKSEEYKQFETYFQNLKEQNKNTQFILKPGEFSNRGQEITVWNSLSSIKAYIGTGRRKWYIIQKYISNPLLISSNDGKMRKFDIRCFGLFTSINGQRKGYFFQDGYLRTASKEYSSTNINDKFIHLTNDAIQK